MWIKSIFIYFILQIHTDLRDKLAKIDLRENWDKSLRDIVIELGKRMNTDENKWYSKDITLKDNSWYKRHRNKPKIEEKKRI